MMTLGTQWRCAVDRVEAKVIQHHINDGKGGCISPTVWLLAFGFVAKLADVPQFQLRVNSTSLCQLQEPFRNDILMLSCCVSQAKGGMGMGSVGCR
jgi:hypothetical protein